MTNGTTMTYHKFNLSFSAGQRTADWFVSTFPPFVPPRFDAFFPRFDMLIKSIFNSAFVPIGWTSGRKSKPYSICQILSRILSHAGDYRFLSILNLLVADVLMPANAGSPFFPEFKTFF